MSNIEVLINCGVTPRVINSKVIENKHDAITSFFQRVVAKFSFGSSLLTTLKQKPEMCSILGGRSPQAAQIYAAYLNDYSTLCGYIDQINAQFKSGAVPAYARQDIATIQSLLTQLGSVYQADYSNDEKNLVDFENDVAGILASAEAAYTDGIGGGGSIQDILIADYTNAAELAASIETSITTGNATVTSLTTEASTLSANLTAALITINKTLSGAQKEKALADYNTAQTALSSLASLIAAASSELEALTEMSASLTGPLAVLKTLSSKTDPTDADLETATKTIETAFTPAAIKQSEAGAALQAASGQVLVVKNDVIAVNTDINPTPTPVPGKIDRGCWYIDWTTWFNGSFPMPDGIDTINIFVGELNHDNQGIGGFGNLPNSEIKAFVAAAKEAGVTDVKISIGGGGGSYDDTWDFVTSENYTQVAQSLVDFCRENDLSGVDFDYEEFKVSQEPLIGQLINAFKTIGSELKASLCANAGFSGWSPHVARILDETKDPTTGKSCLDHLLIMSYYDALEEEQAWLQQWANWIATNYNMSPSQLGVGIDDFDAHAYDPATLKAWAESEGYSWCHWAYNPAAPTTLLDKIAAVFSAIFTYFTGASSNVTTYNRKVIERHAFELSEPKKPSRNESVYEEEIDPRIFEYLILDF